MSLLICAFSGETNKLKEPSTSFCVAATPTQGVAVSFSDEIIDPYPQ